MVDVAVVGSGPNGLAAAVTMARAGLSVQIFEAADSVGGGTRTKELTLPGFHHDVCAAVHPMALASPFFNAFELSRRIELIVPEVSYGHPLDGGRAGIAYRSLERTVDALGVDGRAWRTLMTPLLNRLEGVIDFTQGSLLRLPADPLAAIQYGARTLLQGTPAWNLGFREGTAPAMLTGVGAHAIGRLPALSTAGAGLLLGVLAHAGGWPVPRGGSQAIAQSMAEDLQAHGGRIELAHRVDSLSELKSATGAKAVIFNTTPRALVAMAGKELPANYVRKLDSFKYGAGVCKVDFALSGPVPWTASELRKAPTLHLGGTRASIASAENQVLAGRHPENPYVLAVQAGVVDDSRAPEGHQTFWAYTHVPAGSTRDCTDAIIRAVERQAPGFRDLILATHTQTAQDVGRYNPNYIDGDISSGAVTMMQLLKRPVISPDPWRTPVPGVYLGSASTTPGPSVHGMGGWLAARSALKNTFGLPAPALGL
ncbi:Phytoene dehydrogenase-related protein [Arthrobacter alpinus]|uniref:Pyridine nucleotide-disulfide oxidoreductase domain-containing protein 2 n=1 Tax=Arthrobacter alpinus TaxID=656366 RepID=A0A1H5N011_9MICC|nr:NAD(P)/FAD-dependent oxidoreductase [Arthrobacter alpinus]SEE94287.1 Phytoene dehydrogenase-related protein [Arthrobacter alpinus]